MATRIYKMFYFILFLKQS